MLCYYLHQFDPVIVELPFGLALRWYGFAYVLAFLCGFFVMRWLSRQRYAELPPGQVADFITLGALLGVLLGGRLGYVLLYRPEMLAEPLSILRVWEGGMSSHGGMVGLILYTFWYSRRYRLSWRNLGDNLGVAAPLGLFFGRLANFINGELFGRPTTVPWAVQFPKELLEPAQTALARQAVDAARQLDPAINSAQTIVALAPEGGRLAEILRGILTPRHPSQIYQALLEGLLLFLILWFVRTRRQVPNGVLTGLFFVCYAVLRIIGELFREPDAGMVGPFTRGQFFSLFLILIGIGIIFFAYQNPRRAPRFQ